MTNKQKKSQIPVVILAGLILFFMISSNSLAAGESQNGAPPVLSYLNNAEIQYENDAQKQSIVSALGDCLKLSPDALCKKRYSNYSGQAGQWDICTFLERHFVPDRQDKHLSSKETTGCESVCKDIKQPKVQEKIRALIENLGR